MLAQIAQGECIRPRTPSSLDDARLVKGYVEHYNHVRLNGAIGHIPPKGTFARENIVHLPATRS